MEHWNWTRFINKETGLEISNVDIILTSLFDGLQITIKGGSKDLVFNVRTWEYVFSSNKDDKCGLFVYVNVES